jgi:histidine ammonia-lyase
MNPLTIATGPLTLRDVAEVARLGRAVELDAGAAARMERSCSWLADTEALIYGLGTNVGAHSHSLARDQDRTALRKQMVRNHRVGVGPPLDRSTVRAAMLLMAHYFAKGLSGVRAALPQTLIAMLNADLIPRVPAQGSVGSSGDLVPLSYIAAVVFDLDEGDAAPEVMSASDHPAGAVAAREAMARAGLAPIVPEGIEALALINGTWVSTAIAALTAHQADRLLRWADVAAALSMEALGGFQSPLASALHESANPGQRATAGNLRLLLAGSELAPSVADVQGQNDCAARFGKVHDPYSLRCVPQIHGASKDAVSFVSDTVATEANGVTGSPIVLVDEPYLNKAFSAGNFHGQSVSLAMDVACIALGQLAGVSERRVFHLLFGGSQSGLPLGLARQDGPPFATFEINQHVAASLVAEIKASCHPSSVDSIPTAANQEDWVSMATVAARKAQGLFGNAQAVIAMEVMLACRAIQLGLDRRPASRLGAGTACCYRLITEAVEWTETDQPSDRDLAAVLRVLDGDSALSEIERASGGRLRGVVERRV